jgi:hypothetical protein
VGEGGFCLFLWDNQSWAGFFDATFPHPLWRAHSNNGKKEEEEEERK